MFRVLTRWLRNRRLDATFERIAPFYDPAFRQHHVEGGPYTEGIEPRKGLPPTEPDEGGPRKRRRDHGDSA